MLILVFVLTFVHVACLIVSMNYFYESCFIQDSTSHVITLGNQGCLLFSSMNEAQLFSYGAALVAFVIYKISEYACLHLIRIGHALVIWIQILLGLCLGISIYMLVENYSVSLALIIIIFVMAFLFQLPVSLANSFVLSLLGRALLFSNPSQIIPYTNFQVASLFIVIGVYLVLTILGIIYYSYQDLEPLVSFYGNVYILLPLAYFFLFGQHLFLCILALFFRKIWNRNNQNQGVQFAVPLVMVEQLPLAPENRAEERISISEGEFLQSITYGDNKEVLNNIVCPICLQNFKTDEVVDLHGQCRNVYHPHCIKEYLQRANRCPICRKVVRK